MPNLPPGLYESLVTPLLEERLAELGDPFRANREPLREAEAADRIALHVARLIRQTIESGSEKEGVSLALRVARRLLEALERERPGGDLAGEVPVEVESVLRAIRRLRPDGTPETISEPLIPLLDTTLLTNAPGEPRVGRQVLEEIGSADRVDVVMAFVRWSGISPLVAAIERHCCDGRSFRLLTTTYTGTTEARALDALQKAGVELRVSYDTGSTRLHAKAWIFHRESGFTTAYIGSSNLTHSAQVSGLEWNVRVSGARNRDVVEKMAAVFESYWNGGEFEPYERGEFLERSVQRPAGPTVMLSPVELRPDPFQERLLEQIELARESGHHRNLLVSATGTGKTVMAAIDYATLRRRLPRSRLLFVAHRQEILEQSLATFRQALRDPSFGELWVGGIRPQRFEHVFASIQSLNASGLGALDPAHFDVVIVDEFHHSAAPSYESLLRHVMPRELLGMTATPERADGLPVLDWFDGRIAAELRLWDAIDQHRLVPFLYYGLADGLDLREVPWRRGRGYDTRELSNLLTANDVWARLVLARVAERVDDPNRMKALGFCVDVEHARFMARHFNAAGIPATAVWADSSDQERSTALADLEAGRFRALFSVDLFNEGVDLPSVDTLLLLRPTDSPTLFLQQLGRGLRRSIGKSSCLVLDFVGRHRTEFRFDRRFRALLGGSRRELERQIATGFPFLPAGCHLELDRVAEEIVLDNIRQALPSRWNAMAEELRLLGRDRGDLGLEEFLEETGLELEDVYGGNHCWSDLRERAGFTSLPSGEKEEAFRRACGRLLHVDDRLRLAGWRRLLSAESPVEPEALSERDRRLLRMLVASLMPKGSEKSISLREGGGLLWAHPQVRAELLTLFGLLESRVDHLHPPLQAHPDVPAVVHARYSRLEILSAFGIGEGARVAPWQTGVYWAEEAKADLLAVTLDKTSGQFSPTTRYRDYAISRDLIHWESQSTTRAESRTGRRYQEHVRQGSAVMLFARMRADERAFWFLGPATYVQHRSERPMAVTWRLEFPLPGDLFASFAAAVA